MNNMTKRIKEGSVLQFPKELPPNLEKAKEVAYGMLEAMKRGHSGLEDLVLLRRNLKGLGYYMSFRANGIFLIHQTSGFKTMIDTTQVNPFTD